MDDIGVYAAAGRGQLPEHYPSSGTSFGAGIFVP